MSNKTQIVKDLPNKKLTVVREFSAPLELVWKAWTEVKSLDEWWAPKPWKTKTKSMNFSEGGTWLYAMVGPDGTQHWCIVEFTAIIPGKSFKGVSCFCDENGTKNADIPNMYWSNNFSATPTGTKMEVELSFTNETDLKTIVEMGFEAGFTFALTNLDELLKN